MVNLVGRPVPDVRWGLTVPFTGIPLSRHADLFRAAEAAGYDDLWTGETAGADGFTPLALAAAVTDRVRLGTGIVNPFTRGPSVLAQHAAALADASQGRFVLGLGSSSNVIVERWNDVPFVKPLSKVREAVQNLRPVLAGERGTGGFKLEVKPEYEIPIVLAALRGKMLGLAAEVADGAFTNWLPVSGARQVADAFGAPDKELVCRFFCIPQPAEEAMSLAKWMFAAYGTVPVYTEFFRWLGWGEAIDPVAEAWHGGDRAGALELVSEELIREIFLFGEEAAMGERLAEFAEGGVTTFVLTPITTPDHLPRMIDALATARP
ncbi:MAG: class flavin-dependent oxidoreductase [Solirubrobacterales bacterium]|nr:class flavin-dependent oxidoreductase [Solirubrobacterales bacterium]